MKIGDKVETMTKRMPVCCGVITALSECGRYATVRKVYGTRSRWSEHYNTSDLRPLTERRNRDSVHNVTNQTRSGAR